jgi:hypothetical protein
MNNKVIDNFYLNSFNKNLYVKKMLSNSLFEKYIIRDCISESDKKNVYTIDNYQIITNILLKKKYTNGFYIFLNRFYFRHKLNKSLQFKNFISYCLKEKTSFINRLYNNIFLLLKKKISYKYLIILRPIKGGFISYSFGIRGFLPMSQYNSILYFFLLNKKNSKKSINLFFFLLKSSKIPNLNFLFKAPLSIISCSIYNRGIKNNFSTRKYVKYSRVYLNFVFIYKANNKIKRFYVNKA